MLPSSRTLKYKTYLGVFWYATLGLAALFSFCVNFIFTFFALSTIDLVLRRTSIKTDL